MNAVNERLPADPSIHRHATTCLPGIALAVALPPAPAQQVAGPVPPPASAANVYMMEIGHEKNMASDITQRVVSAFAQADIQRIAILYRNTPANLHPEQTR